MTKLCCSNQDNPPFLSVPFTTQSYKRTVPGSLRKMHGHAPKLSGVKFAGPSHLSQHAGKVP